jgi:hypothetical protein
MTTKKALHLLDWLASNVTFWFFLIVGAALKMNWALNVFKFLCWFSVFIWGCSWLGRIQADHEGKDFPIPGSWIDPYARAVPDFVLACVCAAFGHWFYSILVLAQMWMEQAARAPKKTSTPS